MGRCGEWWLTRRNHDSHGKGTDKDGIRRHVSSCGGRKKRVAIPAKWRAAARGSQEFYVLPDPKNCLVVLPASAMHKMLERADDISIGEYERRDVLRVIASRAHGTPCDKQGRIALDGGIAAALGHRKGSRSGRCADEI